MKKIKIAGLALAVIFIVLQFFQPEKNQSGLGEDNILAKEKIPQHIGDMLQHSCFDCHSNQTRYPWYDQIVPASWLVANHIREGKKQLNFSDWGKTDLVDKLGLLGQIQEEVKSGSMPLPSYTLIHRNAKLSKDQSEILIKWIDQFSEELLEADSK